MSDPRSGKLGTLNEDDDDDVLPSVLKAIVQMNNSVDCSPSLG